MEEMVVRQAVPLQPIKDHTGADIHSAACGGPDVAAGGCDLKEAAARREPMQEQAPGRSCSLWETHTRAVLEESHPVGRTHVVEVHEGLYPMGGTSQLEEEEKSMMRKELQT
ncbi:epimerase family protein SDR39U1 [Grus japonensis]|uniref:Epimerase family protein SDR39U1 n=1 Tax=Grus japonensis TaxID=30415 RepID=A0ABC9VUJ0_GRUJA